MGRLIREEDVLKVLTKEELLCGTFTEAKIAVGDIPTAYSVEAVVRELETISTFYAHGAEGDKDMGYEYLTIRKYGISDGLDIAIEIVRGGRND